MALEKIIVIDQIEVVENGTVQVRTATKIMDDGEEINRTFHRHVVVPGDDYSAEDDRVQAVCAAVHTPEIIAAYQAAQEAAKPAALEV
jgi:hypothetical protein